jgi:hypothetical protein
MVSRRRSKGILSRKKKVSASGGRSGERRDGSDDFYRRARVLTVTGTD